MAWPERDARCRRHPSHRQASGVCPSCLRERLSTLSSSSSPTTSGAAISNESSSSSSSCSSEDDDYSPASSSSSVSSSASPVRYGVACRRRQQRFGNSRSLAWGGERRGFWSRLLRVGKGGAGTERRGKGDVVLQSQTMRETSSAMNCVDDT